MKLKIKSFPNGQSVTGKYQLLDPDAKAGKSKQTNRDRGYRAIEAGEVIEFDEKDGAAFFEASNGVLEITTEDATRPLYFEDIGIALATSSKFNVDSPEREEEQKAAQETVKEMMSEGTAE